MVSTLTAQSGVYDHTKEIVGSRFCQALQL